jgi:hypothetical protein
MSRFDEQLFQNLPQPILSAYMKVRIGKLPQRFPGVRMVQMKGFLQEMVRVAVSTASALRGVEFQPRVNGRIYLRIEVDKTRQNIGRFQGEMFPKIVHAKGESIGFRKWRENRGFGDVTLQFM